MIKSESELIKEMRDIGYSYKDIHNIYIKKEIETPVVKVILKRFPEVYREHRGTGDHLVRCLISAIEPFDPKPLIDFFEQNIYNSSVMWGVAHVLTESKTTDISVWLKNQLGKEHATIERRGLVPALIPKGGFKTTKELKEFLKKIYDKYPIEVLGLFKKVGSQDDVPFLNKKLKPIERLEVKDIQKVITYLNKKTK